MKRLIVCCDGTWQDLSTPYPTNIVKLAQAIQPIDRDGTLQCVFYGYGIGTRKLDRLAGGAFGQGIDRNIQDAYLFLCLNYEPGDEIYLFGYSRGAYTVRSVVGLINCSGLLKHQKVRHLRRAYDLYRRKEIKPSHLEAQQFRQENGDRVPITLLGCWETVGSLGVPDLIPFLPINHWVNRRYQFHDTTLSAIIERALHAVAVDERRRILNITPMESSPDRPSQSLHQAWFPGNHGAVGGGTEAHSGLSNTALIWMMEQMQQMGLKLALDAHTIEGGLQQNHKAPFDEKLGLLGLAGARWREIVGYFDDLHISTKQRWCDVPSYRPPNLAAKYRETLDAYCEVNRALS
ncbi:MAG: DUF2235 domain-containing protein [Thermosynechococcaceae cyanobacterium]